MKIEEERDESLKFMGRYLPNDKSGADGLLLHLVGRQHWGAPDWAHPAGALKQR